MFCKLVILCSHMNIKNVWKSHSTGARLERVASELSVSLAKTGY
jgi:hypothetical protein